MSIRYDIRDMYSLTYTGVIVALLSTVLKAAGIEIASDELTSFVLTGGQILGTFFTLYGRWRKGDIKWFGTRR